MDMHGYAWNILGERINTSVVGIFGWQPLCSLLKLGSMHPTNSGTAVTAGSHKDEPEQSHQWPCMPSVALSCLCLPSALPCKPWPADAIMIYHEAVIGV